MNKLNTIWLILVFILTAGIITAIVPSSSFMTEVQALSDYELMMHDYN